MSLTEPRTLSAWPPAESDYQAYRSLVVAQCTAWHGLLKMHRLRRGMEDRCVPLSWRKSCGACGRLDTAGAPEGRRRAPGVVEAWTVNCFSILVLSCKWLPIHPPLSSPSLILSPLLLSLFHLPPTPRPPMPPPVSNSSP